MKICKNILLVISIIFFSNCLYSATNVKDVKYLYSAMHGSPASIRAKIVSQINYKGEFIIEDQNGEQALARISQDKWSESRYKIPVFNVFYIMKGTINKESVTKVYIDVDSIERPQVFQIED